VRTVRRLVLPLNLGKRQCLKRLLDAYAQEKRHWLDWLARKDRRHLIKSHRQVRDQAVRDKYQSVSGLPARLWKLALTDAAETWDKYWQSILAAVRTRIKAKEYSKQWNDIACHYANWLLFDYKRVFACLDGQVPIPSFPHEAAMLPRVAAAVRRWISRSRGQNPTVRQARSMVLDADCYRVFVKNGRQYLTIMTMERGRRLVLPLSGYTAISGNIRMVMDNDRVAAHISQALKDQPVLSGPIEAVDIGYSEAFVDTDGLPYGE